MKIYLYASFILTFVMAIHVAAQSNNENVGCATNPPDLSKLSYNDASDAVNSEENSISAARKKICPEYIANLANEIQLGNLDEDKRILGVWLLGKLHPTDTNSIEVLIRFINLKAKKFDLKTDFRRWGNYPAKEALIKIGQPVLNPILNHLPDETDELRRHLMCGVLLKVEGKEPAQIQIKERLAGEPDSTKRTNLELVLKELEK